MLLLGYYFSTRIVLFASFRTPVYGLICTSGSVGGFGWETCIHYGLNALTLLTSPNFSFSNGCFLSGLVGLTVIQP